MRMYLQSISYILSVIGALNSMQCYEILLRMQYFSCGSDKYTEIKMCDLEPFSKIQSQLINTHTGSIFSWVQLYVLAIAISSRVSKNMQ